MYIQECDVNGGLVSKSKPPTHYRENIYTIQEKINYSKYFQKEKV